MVETGSFCTGLLALGQVPAKVETLALYGEHASDQPERSKVSRGVLTKSTT